MGRPRKVREVTGNGSSAGSATPTSGRSIEGDLEGLINPDMAPLPSVVSTAGLNRTRKPGPRTPQKLASVQDLEKIAVLRSQGIGMNEISKALRVNRNAVVAALRHPDVVGQITFYRERLRGTHIAAAQAISGKAWEKAEEALDNGEARDFDAITRGLHAIEKISASASGENMRMEVTHQGSIASEPVKVQLQQLIALVRSESS